MRILRCVFSLEGMVMKIQRKTAVIATGWLWGKRGVLVLVLLASGISGGLGLHASERPLFDMEAITGEPLDGKVLESSKEDGIVLEKIEFTSRLVDGKPERVQGVFAYPEGGKNLPAIFWSMGGMAPANKFFPSIYAKKGYACLAITLPHKIRASRARFDADHPEKGNFTLLARDQLRGITYLSQRPEVNADKMGVGGASYGGVFATLLAGIDPRLKAGWSFFGGGNHALGSNLPQFTKLQSLEEVEIWNRTVDGAFRHKTRSIPFLWAVAFNDNWFSFPAVIQTYKDAIDPDKRLVIMPRWRHGFPENVDQELADFPDTVLTKTRAPYNHPGALEFANESGRPVFRFQWTGENPVKSAELIVSYGEDTRWFGWLHRACFIFPAAIQGKSASAVLPIPSKNLPLIAWANITDDRDVVTSTLPVVLTAKDLAPFPADPELKLNCFYDEDFGPEAVKFYTMSSQFPHVVADTAEKQAGAQSLRVEAPPDPAKPHTLKIDLFHSVPRLAHHFSVWVKAAEPMNLTVALTPVRPANWDSAVVAEFVSKDPRLAPFLPSWKEKPKPIEATRKVGPEWQKITLDVPAPDTAVEGYVLTIGSDARAPFWVDTLRMEPVWP